MSNCHHCIEVKNLFLELNGKQILRDISFTLHCGEYVGLIGPNGGGKTSLLKVLLGIYQPTQGQIHVHSDQIGYVPQKLLNGVANFPASVSEIVASGQLAKKITQSEIKKFLKQAGAEHLQNRTINNLSGGELQRVFIARALAKNPNLLVLDEPNTGIDQAGQQNLTDVLKNLNQQFGITILVVSHDIDLIKNQAGRFLLLNQTLSTHETLQDLPHITHNHH